jgi:hypothetical protein
MGGRFAKEDVYPSVSLYIYILRQWEETDDNDGNGLCSIFLSPEISTIKRLAAEEYVRHISEEWRLRILTSDMPDSFGREALHGVSYHGGGRSSVVRVIKSLNLEPLIDGVSRGRDHGTTSRRDGVIVRVTWGPYPGEALEAAAD